MPEKALFNSRYFYRRKIFSIDLKYQQRLSSFFRQKTKKKKIQIFDKIHELIRLKKCQKQRFLKVDIPIAWNGFLSIQNISKPSFRFILRKDREEKNFHIFDKNHGLRPLVQKYYFLKVDIFIAWKAFRRETKKT